MIDIETRAISIRNLFNVIGLPVVPKLIPIVNFDILNRITNLINTVGFLTKFKEISLPKP